MPFPSGPLVLVRHQEPPPSKIPTLSWRQIRQRRVGLDHGLHLGFRRVYVSTVLMPNMDDATARHVPPYNMQMFCERTQETLLEISAWTIQEARQIHEGLVAMLKRAHRFRTRWAHTSYRRRRGRYGHRRR